MASKGSSLMSKNFREIGEVTLRRDKDRRKADRTGWTKRMISIRINPKLRNKTNSTIKLIDTFSNISFYVKTFCII